MQALSLNLDRLAAALKALRQTHDHDAEDKTVLGTKCLAVLINQLAEDGLAKDDLQPLIDLETYLRGPRKVEGPDQTNRRKVEGREEANRRRGGAPSDALLARVSAAIDMLVKAGYEESDAAQALMRRLMAAGIAAPLKGGDSRGWKRLLAWRSHLVYGGGSAEARQEYQAFTRELEAIPAAERVKRTLDEQLWDRRLKPR
jgi:hypothetical protein